MLPKTHIILGAIFSFIIYILFPNLALYNILLVFLSSFLIDFDHYAASVLKNRLNLNLSRSFNYHIEQGKIQKAERDKGIRRKGTFHLFHTLEFHLLIFIISLFFQPFMFIFIGMAFHSLCDIISLTKEDYLYRRYFFLTSWLIDKSKYNKKLKKKKIK